MTKACLKNIIRRGIGVLKRIFLNAIALLNVFIRSDLLPADPKRLKSPVWDEFIVVGTGPSLKETFEQHMDRFQRCSVACVNNFAMSEYFGVIKPDFYFFFDPVYWSKDVTEHVCSLIEGNLNELREKVAWPMTIVMPVHARQWNWFQTLPEANKNVRLYYVNSISIGKDCSPWLKNFLYIRNLAMPHVQTVLVGMAFLAINMGYKNIFLVGADHSWHENILLGEDNILYEQIAHFYAEDKSALRPFFSDAAGAKVFKTHELFKALSLIFEGHHEIAAYADFAGAKVYNASKKTYIDAYERLSL